MLKRLELVGFKSFADKTVFDFGDGITAIVGPNGSGKSNVVDAVRWILGEQSAKSLRGGEMADVIFNGSSSRRSLGLAEVTMTFDNCRRALANDGEEVQITRRVYRDGQGEYLINNQICRLKDIKDLFLGSGAGSDAYCIIEQGKVDVLLQASTRDRRVIFEEAAGISRFKAKKIETLRKLERVDQNVQRLKDIIEEVEKQLRSVKLQAAKAQRYQEYGNRLKELRVALSLREFHELADKLQAAAVELESLRAALQDCGTQAARWETESQGLETRLGTLEDNLREQEAELAEARARLQAEQATISHEEQLTSDLETEKERTGQRLTELTQRVAGLGETVGRAAVELSEVETQCLDQRQGLQELEDAMQATRQRLADLQKQMQADKDQHLEQMRRTARLQNDTVGYKAQVDNLKREHQRLRFRTEQAAESLASIDLELQELVEAESLVQGRLTAARQALTDQREERERLRTFHEETNERVAQLRVERGGLVSRMEVLEGLERSQEGLGTGVREVAQTLKKHDQGPWRTVLGMIADLLTVRREYAPLIDLVLGEWAQRFLIRDPRQLAEALAQRPQPFSGRVSFLPLGSREEVGRRLSDSLPDDPGIIARAEEVVSCDQAELRDLPAQLLGRTLIVRDLATARAIAVQMSTYRFVTLQGELLEVDGTLTVGTHHAETGILSRKSELRDLKQQLNGLDRHIAGIEKDLAGLRERIAALDGQMVRQQEEIDVLAEQDGDLRSRIERHRDKRQGLHEEVTVSRDEIQRIEQEATTLEEAWRAAREQATAAEEQVRALETRVQANEKETRALEQQRQHQQQECTTAQIALAKVEERLAGLRQHHRQLTDDLEQRRREQQEAQQTLDAAAARLLESQRLRKEARENLVRWTTERDQAQSQVAQLEEQRTALRQERARLASQAQAVRTTWRAQQEKAHARELEFNDLKHRSDTLAERLREDYQLELAELYQRWREQQTSAGPDDEPDFVAAIDPSAAQEEIVELRRKLSRLGSVNLDSLQELDELEIRAKALQTQYDDLVAAKRSLEEIIGKINQDSRRLFTETFTTIRGHFQELFRKLFGGGMADIVLEEDADILESGIEIIARPPGKELRSISLMSGGEKTMTAVALLLAIFRSKPSPFCLLDEVDAALDEANIGRFTGVLREFLDQSQFIIITHSKKTMAMADVLYGITMQESGISKRVAVRFEDYPDDHPPAADEGAGQDQSFQSVAE